MNRDDIIRMARDATSDIKDEFGNWIGSELDKEKFANLVAAHEREACVAIVLDNSDAEGICCTDDVLEAFRQRGET